MKRIRRVAAVLLCALGLLMAFAPAQAKEHDPCSKSLVFSHTLELPAGFWTEGDHLYELKAPAPDALAGYWKQSFRVSADAPVLDGQVQLRILRPRSSDGTVTEINPAQDTVFQVSQYFENTDREDVRPLYEQHTVFVSWDGGPWVEMPKGPLVSACTWQRFKNDGWFQRTWGGGKY